MQVNLTIRKAAWLGENLGSAIAERGLQKKFVANKAGIAPDVLSGILTGRRTLTPYYANRLAPVLGVTPEYLLGQEADE